jgi:hypothetical protein
MILKPRFHCICQIYSLSAKKNPRQTACAFEVFDDVSVVCGITDLRYSEKPDQLLLCHDAGTRDKSAIWAWENGQQARAFMCAVHGVPLSFLSGIGQNRQ